MSPLPSFAVTIGPVSWTYPAELVCTKHFDALRFKGLTLHLRGDSTLRKSVEKSCHLPQWVVKFPRYSWSTSFSLRQASNWSFSTALAFAVPPGLNTIAWKSYFIFGSFNFASFLQVYFMYPETVSRSLQEIEEIFSQGHTFTAWKIGNNVDRKTLKEVVEKSKNIPVTFFLFKKNLIFLLYLPPPFSLDKEMCRLTRRNQKINSTNNPGLVDKSRINSLSYL